MKKIISSIVAAAFFVGASSPAFAAINPVDISESSSAANIMKLIDESEETSGVIGGFAWVKIDGKVYSYAIRELRKYSDPSARFVEIVKAQVMHDNVEAAKIELANLKSDTVEAFLSESVDAELLKIAQARINFLETRLELLELYATENADGTLTQEQFDAAVAGFSEELQADHAAYLQLVQDYVSGVYAAGVDSVTVETPVATIDGNNVIITVTASNGSESTLTFDATSIFDAGHTAGVSSVTVADATASISRGETTVDVTVTATNGQTATVSVSAADVIAAAREAGIAQGHAEVSLSSVTGRFAFIGAGEDRVNVTVNATNGETITVSVRAGAAITAAHAAGVASVTYTDVDGNVHTGLAAVTEAQADLTAAQAEVTRLEGVVRTKDGIISTLTGERDTARADLATARSEVTRIQGLLDAANRANSTLTAENMSLVNTANAITGIEAGYFGGTVQIVRVTMGYTVVDFTYDSFEEAVRMSSNVEHRNAAGQNRAAWIAAGNDVADFEATTVHYVGTDHSVNLSDNAQGHTTFVAGSGVTGTITVTVAGAQGQMFTAVTQALSDAIDAAIDAAYTDGYNDGYADGYKDGYTDGFNDGRAS